MSSEATGWVGRHGPRDRAMRFVLLAIADSANRDGEHSHPGTTGIMDFALYGRTHVLGTIDRLVADGWLEVEEQGKGRGHATIFRIPGVRGKVHPPDHSADGKGSVKDQSGVDLSAAEKVHSDDPPLSLSNRKEIITHTVRDAVADEAACRDLCEQLACKVAAHMQRPLPAVTERWRNDMRLLLERGPLGQDQPTPVPAERVARAIDFLFDRLAAPEGRTRFCWADQVRSPRALREHWHQIRHAAAKATERPLTPREQRIAANGAERFVEAAEPVPLEEIARRIKHPEELCQP